MIRKLIALSAKTGIKLSGDGLLLTMCVLLIYLLLPGANLGTDPFGDSTMSASDWTLTPEKILSVPEVESIMERAKEKSSRDYTILCIAANAGFRISEILHLRAEDFDGDRIAVTRRKKKRLRPQSVRIRASVAWAIGEYLGDRTTGYLFPGRAGACYINHLKGGRTKVCDGGHVSRREIQRRFDLLLEGLGLNMMGRGIHTLRHFAVTRFYAKTKNLRACQIFAGHSSSVITENYAHILDMDEIVDSMDSEATI